MRSDLVNDGSVQTAARAVGRKVLPKPLPWMFTPRFLSTDALIEVIGPRVDGS